MKLKDYIIITLYLVFLASMSIYMLWLLDDIRMNVKHLENVVFMDAGKESLKQYNGSYGLHWPGLGYCVNTANSLNASSTGDHELCHALVYDDSEHYCNKYVEMAGKSYE